jgi:oxygen-independent coproporphyrinogen-3 oxidase
MGAQSFHPQSLKVLGRSHKTGQIIKAVGWARQAGFSNLSLDIIYALPGQTIKMAENDLKQLLSLSPEHVSLYQLTLSPQTLMGRQYKPGTPPMPDDGQIEAMENALYALCGADNLTRYEISNFSKEITYQCRHNLSTWQGGNYLALGPGAHGHMAGRRWANYYGLPAYTNAWEAGGQGGQEFMDVLSPAQQAGELFMLGLRTLRGVDIDQASRLLNQPVRQYYAQAINRLLEQNWAVISENYLKPTSVGLKMADSAALYFI